MNKPEIKEKTIQFLINEKDSLCDQITDIAYPDTYYEYKALTEKEIQEINNLRKQIHDIYILIDKIGEID